MSESERLQEIKEQVEKAVSDLAWDMVNALQTDSAISITRYLVQPSNVPAEFHQNIIVPAVTASIYRLLAHRCTKVADDWLAIYEANLRDHCEREGIE